MENLLIKSKCFKNISEIFGTEFDVSIIAGPCSVESYGQMELVAQNLLKNNVRFIRGGAYKPRTSPYDFQGLGLDGLKILDDIRKKYNLIAVSEIMDPRDIELGIKYTDMIQIGSRNMHNYSLLKEVGNINHPILLKRGMMSTIDEFLYAAEYIASNGNENIILCERGIRTFEKEVRNSLDICCIAIIKQETTIPIIVDLSHSAGRKDILKPLAKAVLAAGANGIMVEVCPDPSSALSDREQQMDINDFNSFVECTYGNVS
jgi:3-deoxy-7-phosphoheptulonate synthase/chorismate mutase